ncbi:MAG: thioredoxin family protein [Flavobacteriales bacterium]|nr:thioredoxin family protein [Flavobacteriales bacterium]PIV94874.1 MAG: thioredoxin family protein [Flavobacteriaceae bacterium CG17_big_fil_post_rev_8_21_14_2_50_33_15]PIY11052.1 MAG: thioredoxin family protein [Flavobacteriaceae bacterium CG_4_10_14_3_um_filter_33_47]PJB17342.1 MAG: thioredoxin family protein [Flavobacteriaceae bacterium CG_4_9_14_3_um_filter_33_16]NCP53063.1 thioredoxin family protein [Flavobacteriales bacterium]
MAQTPSNMIALNTNAPDFWLFDTNSEKMYGLNDLKGRKGTVIMFICNHCPFVIHINSELVNIANTYLKKEIGFIAISSNDAVKYPQDGPEKMKIHAKNEQYPFPYLYDESQNVAKAYKAACTPDLYVFDSHLKLTYRGQLDDSRPGNAVLVTGNDLRNALDCLLENKENLKPQKPSIGCNIKWK